MEKPVPAKLVVHADDEAHAARIARAMRHMGAQYSNDGGQWIVTWGAK
jgi:hypothetical protein